MTSDYMTRFLALRDAKDYHGIIDSIPYARLLGVEMSEDGEGNLLFTLPLPSVMSAIPFSQHCTVGSLVVFWKMRP